MGHWENKMTNYFKADMTKRCEICGELIKNCTCDFDDEEIEIEN